MKVTTVSVSVSKMFSDGNYGHQEASVTYTAEVGDKENADGVTATLLTFARTFVAEELTRSETLNIRRAVNPRPRLCNHCQQDLGDWDNYTHKACDEQARAERDRKRAEQQAEWARLQNAAIDREEELDEQSLYLEDLALKNEMVAARGPSDDR